MVELQCPPTPAEYHSSQYHPCSACISSSCEHLTTIVSGKVRVIMVPASLLTEK